MANDIQTVRAQISALQREREDLQNADMTRTEAKALLEQSVAALFETGRARLIAGVAEHATGNPEASLFPAYPLGISPGSPVDLGSALAVVLGQKALMAALAPIIREQFDDGLDAQARSARIREIGAELDRLEHEEEDLIEASEAAGTPIARRGNARPEVVLRVREM